MAEGKGEHEEERMDVRLSGISSVGHLAEIVVYVRIGGHEALFWFDRVYIYCSSHWRGPASIVSTTISPRRKVDGN